ncbi:MAG: thiosulfate sulfurtransferase [Gammaproteobacteria bacterium]|nr:MAG: thiosulfate sulfurtransferase [Gammaproteobacteria bacterium]
MAPSLIVSEAELAAAELAAAELAAAGRSPDLHLIDLRPREQFDAGHIPGAVHADAMLLSKTEPPVGGLLPDAAVVTELLQAAGVNAGGHVVAIDTGAATAAARLVWVLHAFGINAVSWLDGGMAAWHAAGGALDSGPVTPVRGDITLSLDGANVIDASTLLTRLADDTLRIVDTRSRAEYLGDDVRSAFGGHVPGALHADWIELLQADGRLKPRGDLADYFKSLGLAPDQDIVVYCQTHQRSSVTYVVLKALGYERVLGLDGAWSAWGNRADLPKERGAPPQAHT